LGWHHMHGVRWFVAVGIALVLAQFVLIRVTSGLNHTTAEMFARIWPLILGLSIPTALAFWLAPRLAWVTPTRLALGVLFFAGLAMRLVWFGQVPPVEDDFQRYMWDGGVVANGMNPYRFPPLLFDEGGGAEAPKSYRDLAATAPKIFKLINFPDMRTIYPSTGQLAFALGYLIAPFKVDGLRVVFLAAEIATYGLLLLLLQDLKRSPLWAALYWWNPLPIYMTIAVAHVDALVPPCVLGALLFAYRQRANLAMVMLGLGAGVKIWPVVLAPMVVAPMVWHRDDRRRDWGGAFIASAVLGAVLVVAVGPVIWSALTPGSGLTAYSQGWSMNNAPFAWGAWTVFKLTGSWDLAQVALRPIVAGTTAIVALAAAFSGDRTLPSLSTRFLLVAATVFYLSPAQFPWYALWFLALAALVQNWPLLFASVVLPAYFLFYPLWSMPGGGDKFFFGAAFIHSVPVLGWLAWDWHRNRQHGRRET
jgi:alpha-1,6-mannosyltransferase